MIYNNTSVKRVISKVFTDLDLQEGDHRITDMIEWCGEALEKIGAFPQFNNKVTGKDGTPILPVINYQTRLPHDFHTVIQVAFSPSEHGPFYPMRYATGSFDYAHEINHEGVVDMNVFPDTDLIDIAMTVYQISYQEALAKINSEPITRSNLTGILNSMSSISGGDATQTYIDTTNDYTYTISSNYVKTNVQTGYIMMAYQAIPVDDEGYPLVPDNASFLEALYWYVVMKSYYPQWKQGTIRDVVYYDAKKSWNYYCKQAYGTALMPNIDQLESIKNSWNRLVPELFEHETGFSSLGDRQQIYNAN
jgi:hypothetical protein